jgi:UDP-N-acetylmuramate--alanine ligase
MGYPGRHNLENALAALALCAENGLDPKKLAEALENFPGVWRRFEKHFDDGNSVYYDDYAHHPGELKMLIESFKELHPSKDLTLIFQPHLFSRTKDFMAEFARELSRADQLILLPIYPAREEPMPGITSDALLEMCSASEQSVVQKEELVKAIQSQKPQLLVTAGAGDIDRLVAPITEIMKQS